VARTALALKALAADRFLAVVVGYGPSARTAAAAVDDRLGRYAPKGTAGEAPAADDGQP
jgi:hypothetical protein